MGLSDCPKCWDTPCTCGHEYREHWSLERLIAFRDALNKVIQEKEEKIRSDGREADRAGFENR